jgi:uncharacterized protein
MIELGKHNLLYVLRKTPPGLFLGDLQGGEVLLPNKYIPENIDVNDEIEVFIYKDSEDRIIATTLDPKIYLHEFAALRVKEVNDYGAFLDWGLEKDLMVPYREQTQRMRTGDYQVVYLYIDEETGRLAATNKVERYLDKGPVDLTEGEEVDLLVWMETDLGYNVIVNNRYKGLLYHDEIFKRIEIGDALKGFVKKVREDDKLDITIQKRGLESIDEGAQVVLEKLRATKEGMLKLSDKSSPEEIVEHFEMSKKTFKKAIGALYRQKIIRIENDGIYLT